MLQKKYDSLYTRWQQYWNMGNHDRPLMSITTLQPIQKPAIATPVSFTQKWEDIDYVLANARRKMQNTYYGGEAFPSFNPDLGPDIVGAVAGCEIIYGADTSWAEPCVEDWSAFAPICFDENNKWWKKIQAITKAAVEDANGDYLVGITDLHPGTDGLVSLRGPQDLCYDLIDEPGTLIQRSDELFAVYKEMHTRLANMIRPIQQGSTNWMGIWNPEREWYVVGSDFSCMLNTQDYESFVVPGLQQEIDYLSESIYHLDGPDALRHLDRILAFEKLGGVQWVYGAGQPSARHWIEVLQKIQKAGKRIQVHCLAEDVIPVCSALRPEGVHLVVDNCKTPDEAEQLLSAAVQASKR